MTTAWPFTGSLLSGPLCSTASWPFTIQVRCGDLRPRFLFKTSIHGGCRAVARNGRILLCADRSMEELAGSLVRVRLQTWHRSYLPGETPEPHGILVCVRCRNDDEQADPDYAMELRPVAEARGELRIEVGGGMMLDCGRKPD